MGKPSRHARRLVRSLKSDPACTSLSAKPAYSDAMAYALGEVEILGRLGPEGLARHLAAIEAIS